jgi:choline dehydrogenase-like flavoprotein
VDVKPVWDLVVVGAGPAGSAAALGALAVNPALSVLLLDRFDFPRDKACGDGIAPQVLDLLESVGVTGLLDDRTPVRRLALRRGELEVARDMARPGLSWSGIGSRRSAYAATPSWSTTSPERSWSARTARIPSYAVL